MEARAIKAMMADVAPVIREFTAAATAPLSMRLDALEADRAVEPIDQEKALASLAAEWRKDLERIGAEARATIAELRAEVASLKSDLREGAEHAENRVAAALATVKDGAPGKDGRDGVDGASGQDGKDADPELIAALVSEAVQKAAGTLVGPKGEDGKPGEKGDPGERGEDGKGADPELIAAMVSDTVTKAISDIDLPRGEKGEKGEPGERGPEGLQGKDGASLIGLMIDRDGRLQATLTDGATRDLGVIVGKDGLNGQNGADGAPGRDGLGFDDLTVIENDAGVFLRFARGEETKEFRLPIVRDCGVFKEGASYQRGDGVTWGGSFWIAQEDTSDKPDSGKGFRLAVKRGRDGKDGIVKSTREPQPVKA